MSYKTYYNRYTSLLLPFLSIFFILTSDWAQALRPYLLTGRRPCAPTFWLLNYWVNLPIE